MESAESGPQIPSGRTSILSSHSRNIKLPSAGEPGWRCLSDSSDRMYFDYPINLQDGLPTIRIPLLPGDDDVAVNAAKHVSIISRDAAPVCAFPHAYCAEQHSKLRR